MQSQTTLPPSFMFRIDEIYERREAPVNIDHRGRWVPLAVPGCNQRKGTNHGASYQWYYFNGISIQPWSGLPENTSHFKTFSVYYGGGAGLYVFLGDATTPADDQVWHSIMFDHHEDFSSTVSHTGAEPTLRCHDPNLRWPKMLLPDIYHGPELAPHPGRGGLKGELPIFLALIALSMRANRLRDVLPYMVNNGRWVAHNEAPGYDHKRGVVVSVYAYQNNRDELETYEDGGYGKFYNG